MADIEKKENNQDQVLATINGYLSSKKYILDKMYYSLNPINEKKEVHHSNKPPENFLDYLKYFYGIDDSGQIIRNVKGLIENSDLYYAIKNYAKKNPSTASTDQKQKDVKPKTYDKKPDVFFISDIKAAYIGESEPKGGGTSKNYNINYISLGFLIDKILNDNIGIKMKLKDSQELIDIFKFVETPIKIVNSPYLISKNYSACLIPQIHPYSTGAPGEIKQNQAGTAGDGAKTEDKDKNKKPDPNLIYDKLGTKLYSWKDTIWDMKLDPNKSKDMSEFLEESVKIPEKDYVNLRYLLLNEQWIVKLFNSGAELGKVLENIVNEIQSAVFGWWQLVIVADNVNNNIKIVDTRGDINDRKEESVFKFQLYPSDNAGTSNSIIREVTIETQMSNAFTLSAMYKQNEEVKEGESKDKNSFNLANSSFNNMWNINDKNTYEDSFLNKIIIEKVNYDNPTIADVKNSDQYIKFYDKQYKSVYVAEDK